MRLPIPGRPLSGLLYLTILGYLALWYWWIKSYQLDAIPFVVGTLIIIINVIVGFIVFRFDRRSTLVLWAINLIIIILLLSTIRDLLTD